MYVRYKEVNDVHLLFLSLGILFLIILAKSFISVFFFEDKWETLYFSNGFDGKDLLKIYSYLQSQGIKCRITNFEDTSKAPKKSRCI